MKVAIVHDWLVTYAGAERVLEQILLLYPDADLFCIVDFLPAHERAFLGGKVPTTSFIQRLPFAQTGYRKYLPLMPHAVERFDLYGYDLVISSSHAVAKGAMTGKSQIHICYCHTPMRYAWDLRDQYLKESGLDKGLKSVAARLVLSNVRNWDEGTAKRVDHFIANSGYIAERIRRVYGRRSTVIYPPVDVDAFGLERKKEDYYVTVSRMVPYKKVDLIVEAFAAMPDRRLIVIGDGPDMPKIRKKAGKNVELLGYQRFDIVKEYLQKAKAFVFAAEEDFGIAPVEAQACGTPVIAYGKGGVLETVIEGETGLFFHEQTKEKLTETVRKFEKVYGRFDCADIRQNAKKFGSERFRKEFNKFIEKVAGEKTYRSNERLVAEGRVCEVRPARRPRLNNTVSVIIPTFNAERQLRRLLPALQAQSAVSEILVVDSSSTDDTVGITRSFGLEPISIRKEDFDHGGTRTLAGKKASGDILVYLTQDALPVDEHAVRNLTVPFNADKEVGGAYGRQLPWSDASDFAAHLRLFNYPETSYIRTFDDRSTYGIKTAFISDSFAAYRRSALEKIGWFKNNLISGEDTYAGAKLLSAGYKLHYISYAMVYHSHNYTMSEEFRRYFDTGVFHSDELWIPETFGKAEGEGIRYVFAEFRYLISRGKYNLLLEFVSRNMMKYTGYRLGRSYRRLPVHLSKKISKNKEWWGRNTGSAKF